MANLKFACVFALVVAAYSVYNVEGLQSNYYFGKCPNYLDIQLKIEQLVLQEIESNFAVAPQFLRMIFHDCFVQGCDASILLNSVPAGSAEKDSVPDSFFFIYSIVDTIKAQVESLCPGVVSCADILAFAAATSVAAAGGPTIDVKGGRYDGKTSLISDANANIPSPLSNLATLESLFTSKGLTNEDLVVLSGAHTIGAGHCGAFTNRLAPLDPALDPTYAKQLNVTCPPATFGPNTTVNMDTFTPTRFDNWYYVDVATKKGLFNSDAALYGAGANTKSTVDMLKYNNGLFSLLFEESLIKLTSIGVKTASNGNIRAVCTSPAPAASPPPKGYGGFFGFP